MREWKENSDKLVQNQLINTNSFSNALVVISNLIARASTKWSLQETKLFLCAITQIKNRDKDNWVKLSKKDVCDFLDIDRTNRPKLRDLCKKMMMKSFIEINGQNDDEWLDGFLMINSRSDKNNVYLQFNSYYLPLLDNLTSHFTEFYLESISQFTSIHSYNLYVYLCSYPNTEYLIKNQKIIKSDLYKVFNLKINDYWRNYGTDKARFDFTDFEKRVLNVAISEINSLAEDGKCDLRIESCKKIKDGHFVLGYDIHYCFIDKNGIRI